MFSFAKIRQTRQKAHCKNRRQKEKACPQEKEETGCCRRTTSGTSTEPDRQRSVKQSHAFTPCFYVTPVISTKHPGFVPQIPFPHPHNTSSFFKVYLFYKFNFKRSRCGNVTKGEFRAKTMKLKLLFEKQQNGNQYSRSVSAEKTAVVKSNAVLKLRSCEEATHARQHNQSDTIHK